ncbi:hypothetical protein JSE7799_02725 [Jannaschia seosinensis]|uniref:Insertion element IS402-like domain-containing protein n=1 Tax=Jannaschia seosinensis TaxID=313367 RepID=A0A0M7BF94_9RHOB|nr:hypothetical protein JSE7799_02725 [Jannaschia seosinensis]
MRPELVTDEIWVVVEPLLPNEPPKPKGGRPRVSDRGVLYEIVFVLRSGLPRGMLPCEVCGCSGMTCWRRLRDWQQAGVRNLLHRIPLERLDPAGALDWSRASLDAASRSCPSGRTRRTVAVRARNGIASPTETARCSA